MVEYYTIENILNEFETKEILKFSLKNISLEEAKIGPVYSKVVNKKVRKSKIGFYNYFEKYTDLKNKLENILFTIFNIKGCNIDLELNFQFTEYKTGEYYHWHTDSSYSKDGYGHRFCSLVILLNDDYEGGDLELKNKDEKTIIFPKKSGNAFLFLSNLEHRVTEVKSGIRYSLVGWFSLKKRDEKSTLI